MVHFSVTKRNTNAITVNATNLWVTCGLRVLARDGVEKNLVNITRQAERGFARSIYDGGYKSVMMGST